MKIYNRSTKLWETPTQVKKKPYSDPEILKFHLPTKEASIYSSKKNVNCSCGALPWLQLQPRHVRRPRGGGM